MPLNASLYVRAAAAAVYVLCERMRACVCMSACVREWVCVCIHTECMLYVCAMVYVQFSGCNSGEAQARSSDKCALFKHKIGINADADAACFGLCAHYILVKNMRIRIAKHNMQKPNLNSKTEHYEHVPTASACIF